MKKLTILLVFAMFIGIGTISAQNEIQVGGSLGYSTRIASVGIGIDGVYHINDKISAAGNFTYYFEKDLVSWMTIDANVHYNLTELENSKVYGLAGLDILIGSVNIDMGIMGNYSSSFTDVGLNLGAGINHTLTDKISLLGEAKFVLIAGTYINVRAGILYNL
jgi:hypothetical protein